MQFEVTSPGLILQSAEKFFSGMTEIESVMNSNNSNKLDTMLICRTLCKGDWVNLCKYITPVTKNDIIPLKNCILGYLKTVVLKSTGTKAVSFSKAINHIVSSSQDELSSFISCLCLACAEIIKANK